MKTLMLCTIALLLVSCASKDNDCCEKKPEKKEHQCKRCAGKVSCPN